MTKTQVAQSSQKRTHLLSCVRSYFNSGWTFLLPYLTAYLLYAWLGWPVNPNSSGDALMFSLPSLLHLFWALHAAHVILAGVALWSWFKFHHSQINSPALHALSTILWPLTPWLFLALLFYIPSIYLEWPSDPWEHLRRINEWHAHSSVLEHSSWHKSSYFLPYSLTYHLTALPQLNWLNGYYTSVCLLLSWQYYRLARSIHLSPRLSFAFALLNAVTFGNSTFSFYRYYGLSSSILAQIGAVALMRITLEVLTASNTRSSKLVQRPIQYVSTFAQRLQPTGAAFALLPLIAFNHIQGIGIACLGIGAGIVWRLIEWKRSMIFWLSMLGALVSVSCILWFPRHPVIDEQYLPQGWLTPWYGFNIFSISSPAFTRCLHILGAFGLLNLLVGIWLIIRKNHIVGWMVLMPILALSLPCFALPIAHGLASRTNPANIITFHRFLFAIPMGLALVVNLAKNNFTYKSIFLPVGSPSTSLKIDQSKAYVLLCTGLAFATLLFPGASAYNRLWHALGSTPDDLNLRHITSNWPPSNLALAARDSTLSVNHPLVDKVKEVFVPSLDRRHLRQIHAPFNKMEIERRLERLIAITFSDGKYLNYLETTNRIIQPAEAGFKKKPDYELLILATPSFQKLVTPASQAAQLSNHWSTQFVPLKQGGASEMNHIVLSNLGH